MLGAFITVIKRNMGKKHNPIRVLIGSIISVIFFALLYWLNDKFCRINVEDAKKKGMIEKDKNNKFFEKENFPKTDFLYYLWFSLITQTTVGYSDMLPSEANNHKYHLEIFKYNQYINMIQLLSIFVLAAYL
jgi:hypothetical protein